MVYWSLDTLKVARDSLQVLILISDPIRSCAELSGVREGIE